ncbi:Smr/MutS family protein [uncultured Methylobacterium sp.]|uniref:Smr/MutS family protein n=1 Tax=uncultured Methylobacterium sp. TaxID=157278 RepID=UPI0035C99653
MRRPRRPRTLSREEARLWGEIAKLITPLRGRAVPKATAPAAPQPPAAIPHAEPAAEPIPTPAVSAVPKPAAPPAAPAKPKRERAVKLAALAPALPRPALTVTSAVPGAPGLERRERQRLSRGRLAIEARIDLHGLYQAEAHAALVGFLMRARAAGHARVLVVTGKGGEDAYAERGVLRRSVPHWLRGADLRGLVLGFEEAARHHGGAGALYVRLRRR